MLRHVVKCIAPEDEEIAAKRSALEALNEELAEREMELVTLQANLDRFHRLYIRIVGARFAELDDLDARIAAIRARLEPGQVTEEAAETARERAHQTREEADTASRQDTETPKFEPSPELKALYRDLAKKIHPDLASTPEERESRTRLMAEVNAAYERGDEEALRHLMRDAEHAPERVEGQDVGAELVRLIRKIAAVKVRLAAIADEIAVLEASDLGRLYREHEEALTDNQDLLRVLALNAEADIADHRRDLLDWELKEANA